MNNIIGMMILGGELMPHQTTKYSKKAELIDDREFELGQIWLRKDELLTIPQADRIKNGRKMHEIRAVVITQNNEQNYNKMCPIITVAPLSHRIDLKRKYDVELSSANDNVDCDCIVQIPLCQPVLKIDLEEMKGIISTEKMAEIIDAQLERLGIDID